MFGLKNLLSLLKSYFNSEIVKTEFPFTDVKFTWLDVDLDDAMEQAKIDHIDIRNGSISINERRQSRGDAAIEGGDKHYVYTGQGISVSIEDMYKQEQGELAKPTKDSKQDISNTNNDKDKDKDAAVKKSRAIRGIQDGTGPYKDSAQRSISEIGQRKESGLPCPYPLPTDKLPEKYDKHSDSYIVNVGSVISTLEQFESTLGKLLREE